MKEFIIRNKAALLYFTAGILAVCILQTFFLPYLLNSLMWYASVEVFEVLASVILFLAGILLLFAALYKTNRNTVPQKGIGGYIGNLLLLLLLTVVVILAAALLAGLLSTVLYMVTQMEYKSIKLIISLVTMLLYLALQPLILWGFSGVIYEKEFKKGLKRAFRSMKKMYWKLFGIMFAAAVIRELAALTGSSQPGLTLQMIFEVIAIIVPFVIALYWFGSYGKARVVYEEE